MKIQFRILDSMARHIRDDLQRSHPFAAERVGFVTCRFGSSKSGQMLILGHGYHPAADQDYVENPNFGALLGSEGFRKIFQIAFNQGVGIFHVHLHEHYGKPRFSGIDVREMANYVPDFFNARPTVPHGALVFSLNSITGSCWLSKKSKGIPISDWSVVGSPILISRSCK
jgi:hypothetical protein